MKGINQNLSAGMISLSKRTCARMPKKSTRKLVLLLQMGHAHIARTALDGNSFSGSEAMAQSEAQLGQPAGQG